MQQVRFWNGNKSVARQQHELMVMEQLVQLWQRNKWQQEQWQVVNDPTPLPKAEDEGNVLNGQADILVTVAGNPKFSGQAKIAIDIPIANGLLGHRLIIIKRERLAEFQQLDSLADLAKLSVGIPATWVDAELFRSNGCQVVERGSFEEIFARLKRGEFDYVALGANEILDVYQSMVNPADDLVIEPSIMLYYPFPLVFYVAANQFELAEKVQLGLEQLRREGQLNQCFERFYGDNVAHLKLASRKLIQLENPLLNGKLANYQSPLQA